MTTPPPASADPTIIFVVWGIFFVASLGCYIWYALMLGVVFERLGAERWKAWVPLLNEAEVFRLGGVAPWSALLFLVPIAQYYALYLKGVAASRIGARFGRGIGTIVVAILVPPVWATVLARSVAADPGLHERIAPSTMSRSGYSGPVSSPQPPAEPVPPVAPGAGLPSLVAPPAPPPPPPAVAAAPPPPPPGGMPPPPPPPPPPTAAPPPPPAQAMTPPPAPPARPTPPAPPAPAAAPTLPAEPMRPAQSPLPPAPTAQIVPPPSIITPPPGLTPPPTVTSAAPPSAPALPPSQPWAPLDRPTVSPAGPVLASGAVDAEPVPDGDASDDLDRTVVVDRRPVVPWHLVVEGGPALRLSSTRVVLGRRPAGADSAAQELAVPDSTRTLSKVHARLELADGVWTVTDLNATNGVIVIGADGTETLLDPGASAPIAERFVLGRVALRIAAGDDDSAR
jgi:hypothetical protein